MGKSTISMATFYRIPLDHYKSQKNPEGMPFKWQFFMGIISISSEYPTEARTFFADQSTPAAAAIAVGVAQGRRRGFIGISP